ncbi:hypothetical protein KKG83_04725 [Candidatus Micrarchaeota archaeon]|nr:hypothetical protein [Candidatus Micrarchaeota archaeon]MBU2476749.1 hypothetical protein [Candidatus Micrarchaeota archaeon]
MEVSRLERIAAFELFNKLKAEGTSTKVIIKEMQTKFGIPKGTLYNWSTGKTSPLGSIGKLKFNEEFFYVIGALLGDGCAYYWRNEHQVWLVGDRKFTEKFAEKLSVCIERKVKSYINRSNNTWFVKISNILLYNLFKDIRCDLKKLKDLMEKENFENNSLQFIEGFFDAEGCVKIIKEKVRKTPKICLDISNNNFELLEIVKKLMEKQLGIKPKYSIQKPFLGKDGSWRKKNYHLRIYKKEGVRKFMDKINSTKLKPEKIPYVQNWLSLTP